LATKPEAATGLSIRGTPKAIVRWGEDSPQTAYESGNMKITEVLNELASLPQFPGDALPVIGATLVARLTIEIGAMLW
jgi:hypothetical protein